MSYDTGKPNTRFPVLKLIKDNFDPGDTLAAITTGSGASTDAHACTTPQGERILLVNSRNTPIEVSLPAEAKCGPRAGGIGNDQEWCVYWGRLPW